MAVVGGLTKVSVEHWWASVIEASWYWIASFRCVVHRVSSPRLSELRSYNIPYNLFCFTVNCCYNY